MSAEAPNEVGATARQPASTARRRGRDRLTHKIESADALEKIGSAVHQLAGLLCLLEARRSELARLDSLLVGFPVGGIPSVEGEREHAGRLRTLISQASELVNQLANGSEAGAIRDALEVLLNAGDWRLGRELVDELTKKAEEQERTIVELAGALHEHQTTVDRMRRQLDTATRSGALVSREGEEVSLLEDLVKQSERALGERRYPDALQLIHRLQNAGDNRRTSDQVLAAIKDATTTAQAISQRDELLVIGQQVEKKQWDYTLLLRSDQGSIQDRTTLCVEDRERARGVADRVAANVNHGIRAKRQRELAPASKPDGIAPVDMQQHLRRIGELLYRLFVPESMHRVLRRHRGRQASSLVLTTNDLELPWEVLHDGDEFLCLTRPVGRMVMGRAMPREKRFRQPNPKLRFLIVYADPDKNLPGAESEIEIIEKELRSRWKDRIEIDVWKRPDEVTGEQFNDALIEGRYDVIHYAGHASFREDDPELSGLLLTNGEMLYAQKLWRLLSGHPLAFLNACESGRAANEQETPVTSYMGKPAEGIASALLDGGAIACVGALWPVYDDAAAEFAVSFYDYLLRGHLVGEALRRARVDSKERHPEAVTWASFALYGDPTSRLAEP
jgi:CHAT domain-containing protein